MESQRIETTAVMARDAGKTEAEADPEVSEGIDFARFYATSARTSVARHRSEQFSWFRRGTFRTRYQRGRLCRTGGRNAVILKPAPETVATAWQLVQHSGRAVFLATSYSSCRPRRRQWSSSRHPRRCGRGDSDGLVRYCAHVHHVASRHHPPRRNEREERHTDQRVRRHRRRGEGLVQSAFGHAGQKCSAAASPSWYVTCTKTPPSFVN